MLTVWAHSWFNTVVDSNELGPVCPFQLKQLKYEDPQDEGAIGTTMDFYGRFWCNCKTLNNDGNKWLLLYVNLKTKIFRATKKAPNAAQLKNVFKKTSWVIWL